ncbi:MAG: alpha/beta hydrolase, partial [Verrucomicrobiota bacterium]
MKNKQEAFRSFIHRFHGVICGVGGAVVLALAPSVRANVPPPQTKALAIRVPALGNANDGTLTTTVTYQNTIATAVATSGNTIWLGKGFEFRITTCVGFHAFGHVPDNRFASRDVDTRFNSGTIYTYAPSITYSVTRPISGESHLTPYVHVLYKDAGGVYRLVSHSWPDNGLQGAGMPVAAQNQFAGAPLPASETTTVAGAFAGAIDSGEPDSLCNGTYLPATGSVPAGLVTNTAAFAGAPAYYEIGAPTGIYTGHYPRAVALLFHGGGWVSYGPGAAESLRITADRWRARGFQTVNVSYRPGGPSGSDALWFYDHIRSTYGVSMPIVTMGQSAGGHLALLVAAYRPGDVYAVISQAGPTDLQSIVTQSAYDTVTGGTQTNASQWVHNLGSAAFGVENLGFFGVVGFASNLQNTRLL